MRLYRFYLEKITENSSDAESSSLVVENPEIVDQIVKVLRLREDSKEIMSFFDGSGSVWDCQITEFHYNKKQSKVPEKIDFKVLEKRESQKEKNTLIRFFIPVIKIEKFEWMIQKLTELGVQELIPIDFERSQKQNLEKISKNYKRFEKIIIEATEQCEGAIPSKILEPIKLEDITNLLNNGNLNIFASEKLADNEKHILDTELISKIQEHGGTINLLVGPEGGITEEECSYLEQRGFHPASLGARLLKAETSTLSLYSSLGLAFKE